jgi:FkbM family methyltransferase
MSEPSKIAFAALAVRFSNHERSGFLISASVIKRMRWSYTRTPKASVYNRHLDHFGMQMDRQETVRLHCLDQLCLEEGIERIHFLKLAVEGHELKVLSLSLGVAT